MTDVTVEPGAPWRKLGLIAGGGTLPVEVARGALAQGKSVYVVGVEGFAEPKALDQFDHGWAALGELGKIIKQFKDAQCDAVSFAGVIKRPDLTKLKVDFTAAKALPSAIMAARKGDDALMRVIVGVFEKAGFHVVAAEEAARGLAAVAGAIGSAPYLPEVHGEDVAKGFAVARAMGAYDIGQGAVVCDGLVLAVEAQEGTDAMLARVAELPLDIRGAPGARRGVLVKAPKPVQDRRIDLPALGVKTVEGAAAAGLAGIAVEAGGALILDRQGVAEAADAAGLFVVALPKSAVDTS